MKKRLAIGAFVAFLLAAPMASQAEAWWCLPWLAELGICEGN